MPSVRDDGLEQFGPLRERRAHEQTAVAAAFDGEFGRRRVVRANRNRRARSKIVERVLFFVRLPA
jgi:hypothetical protein